MGETISKSNWFLLSLKTLSKWLTRQCVIIQLNALMIIWLSPLFLTRFLFFVRFPCQMRKFSWTNNKSTMCFIEIASIKFSADILNGLDTVNLEVMPSCTINRISWVFTYQLDVDLSKELHIVSLQDITTFSARPQKRNLLEGWSINMKILSSKAKIESFGGGYGGKWPCTGL